MMSPESFQLVSTAARWAAVWHEGQYRKAWAPRVPYLAHPATVAMLAAQAGAPTEAVAAAYLHDVIEDCGVAMEEIAERISPDVARIVAAVTESKGLPWVERKAAYRAQIAAFGGAAAWVAWADHVSNVTDYGTLAQDPEALAAAFPHAHWDVYLAHERAIVDVVRPHVSVEAVALLEAAIARMAQAVGE